MVNIKPQWKKRVEAFRFIFSMLMLDNKDANKIKQQAFENNLFDANQLKMIEYFSDHQIEIIDVISKNLSG
jgi:transcription termination factor NusB